MAGNTATARPPLAVTWAVGLLAACALTACSGTARTNEIAPPSAPHSSAPHSSVPVAAPGYLQGTLLVVPPFQRQYPTPGTIVISGHRQLTRHVGPDGRFDVTLPAGDYTLVGHTPVYVVNGREGDCITQTGRLVVQPRQTIRVSVLCAEK